MYVKVVISAYIFGKLIALPVAMLRNFCQDSGNIGGTLAPPEVCGRFVPSEYSKPLPLNTII